MIKSRLTVVEGFLVREPSRLDGLSGVRREPRMPRFLQDRWAS